MRRQGTRRRGPRWVVVAAIGIATIMTPVGAALAAGPGPTWTYGWLGNGSTAGEPGTQPLEWVGTPAYTAFPGGADGADQGFRTTNGHLRATAPGAGNLSDHDFDVSARFQTSDLNGTLMVNRGACAGAPFWDMRLVNGEVHVQAYDNSGDDTRLHSTTSLADGVPHEVLWQRRGTQMTLSIDGTQVSSQTITGSGYYYTWDEGLAIGGGHPCIAENSGPLDADIDHVYITVGVDWDGQDLRVRQDSTPTVPAGGSGSMVVYLENLAESWTHDAAAVVTAPPGVSFTGVFNVNSVCTLMSPTEIRCPAPATPRQRVEWGNGVGGNPITIDFDVSSSATPGSTLNALGTFDNIENVDPDPSNSQNVPLPIVVAEDAAVPLADPRVAAPTLVAAGLVVWWRRRRPRTAVA